MITLKNDDEIQKIRFAAKVVGRILRNVKRLIKPGVRTIELEDFALSEIEKYGCQSAFKGYHGYPCAICTSVNEEVVHAIPGQRKIESGDIISIDVGVRYQGYNADAASTYPVGRINKGLSLLIDTTRKSLNRGIKQAVAGKRVSDISHAIEEFAVRRGFTVVREFVGHGIGAHLHEDPQIPNFGPAGQGEELRSGMVLAIEPMVNMGMSKVDVLLDGWTAVTKDRQPSAHFEHTVLITRKGNEVLTK